jgi:hypothetical protein
MSETHWQELAELTERTGLLERKLKSTRGMLFIFVALNGLLQWKAFNYPDVFITNKVSATGAALETVASGRTGLYFFDRQHVLRAELGLEPDGSPSLVLRDKENKVLFKAP